MSQVVRWAELQWVAVPRRLVLRFPALRGLAGDGHVVVTLPPLAAALPGATLLLGLLCGLLRLGYDAVYTESVVLLVVMVALGFFSSQLGVLVVVGFCLGDVLSAPPYAGVTWSSSLWFAGPLGDGPLATVVHGWLPRLITYLLLAAGVVLLPRAARAVVQTVGRSRRMPPLLAWSLVSALLLVIAWLGTDAWVAAAPTLVRPLFTWGSPNGAPTVEAVATLQATGGFVVAAAVVATALRQLWLGAAMVPGLLQDRLHAAEDREANATPAERAAAARADAERAPAGTEPPAADAEHAPAEDAAAGHGSPDLDVRVPAPPGTARRVGGAVLMSLLATLTLAGILEHVLLWLAAFGVLLAVRLLRTSPRRIGWLERWRRVAALLPAWARLIALWLLSRVVVDGISNEVIGSYAALGVFVLVGVVVVFAFFPGEPLPDDAGGVPTEDGGGPAGPPDPGGSAAPGVPAGPAGTAAPGRPPAGGRPVVPGRHAAPGGPAAAGGRSATGGPGTLGGPAAGGGPGATGGPRTLGGPAAAGGPAAPGALQRVGAAVPLRRRGLRGLQLAVAAWTVTALAGLFTAAPAAADNCSVFTDCFGVANSAAEAAFGLALLAALSMVLDFIPVVGTVKGVVEAVTGRDLLTGQELAWWERALGVLPVLAGLGVLGAAARMGRNVPTPPHVPRPPDVPTRTPDVPHTPDVPRTPDVPHTPDVPRTPDAPPRDPDVPRTPDAPPPRTWPDRPAPGTPEHDLGFDPAVNKFRPSEYQTAQRIIEERGVDITRAPKGSSADWVDSAGNTYDAVGNFPGEFFDEQWPNLAEQIVKHLDKADFVPVDVSRFSPEQIARVREFIEPLSPRVFMVGG